MSLLPEYKVASAVGTYTASGAFTDGKAYEFAAVILGYKAQPPTAHDDAYPSHDMPPIREGQKLKVDDPTKGVLANDESGGTDPDPTMTAVSGSNSTNKGGTLALDPKGTFTYTPSSVTFFGTDTFTYSAKDGSLVSSPATVTITITPPALPGVPDPVTIVTGTQTEPLVISVRPRRRYVRDRLQDHGHPQ